MMLSYKRYVQESVYKLTRQKAGVFKVLDTKLNETGVTLNQNMSFGKDWDLVIGGVSKGSFETKHDATCFIEKSPELLDEAYSFIFVDTDLVRNEYVDQLWEFVKSNNSEIRESIKSKKSLLNESKYWKLNIKDNVIISASIFKDRGTRKLIAKL